MLNYRLLSRLMFGCCAGLIVGSLLLVNVDAQEAKEEEGFVSLFNGKDMTGWVGNTKGYFADGKGNMVCDPTKEGGNVYTEKEYSNFVLRFEFKLSPGANNGLGIRAPLTGDAAYVGMELQILDDSSERYKNVQNWQRHGSLYGIAASKPGHLKPVGEWNSEEVTPSFCLAKAAPARKSWQRSSIKAARIATVRLSRSIVLPTPAK